MRCCAAAYIPDAAVDELDGPGRAREVVFRSVPDVTGPTADSVGPASVTSPTGTGELSVRSVALGAVVRVGGLGVGDENDPDPRREVGVEGGGEEVELSVGNVT